MTWSMQQKQYVWKNSSNWLLSPPSGGSTKENTGSHFPSQILYGVGVKNFKNKGRWLTDADLGVLQWVILMFLELSRSFRNTSKSLLESSVPSWGFHSQQYERFYMKSWECFRTRSDFSNNCFRKIVLTSWLMHVIFVLNWEMIPDT